jgi:hypothetical protein
VPWGLPNSDQSASGKLMRCPGLGLAGFLEQKTQGKFWRGPGRQVCQAIEIDDTRKKIFFVCVSGGL